MISNVTRVFCALLSATGAAGLVAFADPALTVGNHHRATPAPIVAAASAGTAVRG